MPREGNSASAEPRPEASKENSSSTARQYGLRNSWTAPRFIRVIFDRFPLRTYPIEPAPSSVSRSASTAILYVSDKPSDIADERPSRYPSCLKWQTYLKIHKIDFTLESSSAHSSPNGSLPYLLPASSPNTPSSPKPVTSSDLQKWISEISQLRHAMKTQSDNIAVFQTLLDTKIRDAWLYWFYIEPDNFNKSTRSNLTHATPIWPVKSLIGYQIQQAASLELQRTRPNGVIYAADIYSEADAAFNALGQLLGTDRWFSGETEPGLFDAAVFAYTEPLLALDVPSAECPLRDYLKAHTNLINHRGRLRAQYYISK